MQESWSVHAAQNKHAKSFYPSNTWTFLFPITRQEFADQELSLSCPILSSVLDNQKQAVAWDTYYVGWWSHAPGECSCRALPGFPRLADTEYALLVGEWNTAVSPDISQALFSLSAQCVVIQAHGSQGT